MNHEDYISNQIAVYKNSKTLLEFQDKLKVAPITSYAHIHARLAYTFPVLTKELGFMYVPPLPFFWGIPLPFSTSTYQGSFRAAPLLSFVARMIRLRSKCVVLY